MTQPQMKLFPAGAPELVKCNQKDRFYTEHLTSLLSDITRQALPLRFWLKWQRELQLLAELGYYGLTTLLGNQSLGEEYCNVIQVGPPQNGQWVAAGFGRRLLSILLQTFCVYAVEKGLETLHRRVGGRALGMRLSEREYEVLDSALSALEDFVSGVSRLHLALFYMYGLYYHLGKRLAAVKYLMIRYSTGQGQELSSLGTYRVLGWLILAQIAVQVTKLLYKAAKKRREAGRREDLQSGGEDSTEKGGMRFAREEVEVNVASSFRCPLCFELCEHQTATVCGHIFCWKCISEWTSDKSECPVCRSNVQPQQIVCLQHFQDPGS